MSLRRPFGHQARTVDPAPLFHAPLFRLDGILGRDPPSKWWTPLISSFGSRKVFDGYSASSIHG